MSASTKVETFRVKQSYIESETHTINDEKDILESLVLTSLIVLNLNYLFGKEKILKMSFIGSHVFSKQPLIRHWA